MIFVDSWPDYCLNLGIQVVQVFRCLVIRSPLPVYFLTFTRWSCEWNSLSHSIQWQCVSMKSGSSSSLSPHVLELATSPIDAKFCGKNRRHFFNLYNIWRFATVKWYVNGSFEAKAGTIFRFRFMLTFYSLSLSNFGQILPRSRSLVNFVGLEKTVTVMVTGCLRTMKSCHICIKWLKVFLLSN